MIRAPIATSLSTKNSRLSNIFSNIEHRSVRLRRHDDGDRGQVGRERRPRPVLDLRDLPAEVVLDHELLARRHAHRPLPRPRPARRAARTPAGSRPGLAARRPSIVRSPPVDRGEADEAADLDVLRRDRHEPPPSCSTPWMRSTFDSIPSISAPSETRKRQRSWTCGSQAALPITVSPSASDGGHDDVLGRHHARLVEEDRLAAQAGRAHLVARRRSSISAPSSRERVDVRIEAAAADHVAAGRRHGRAAEAREQRAGEQERGADAAAELLVELGLVDARRCRRGSRSRRSTRRRRRCPRAARPSSGRRGSAARSSASRARPRAAHAARIGSAPFLFPAARDRPAERPPALDHEGLHRGG